MAAFVSKREQCVSDGPDYKNTEAVQNQHATHRDILNYGSKIYERKCAELEKLREQSLVELEDRIWGLANEDKERAVKEMYEQGQEQLMKFQENAKKEKEKAVKSECKRVEAYMKKQAMQQLQVADDASQWKLQEVLHDARIEFEVEKMLAIRQAREEEINHAIEDAARVARLEDNKRKKIILQAEKEKAVALKNLKLKMEQKQQEAVDETEEMCHRILVEEMRQCKEDHLAAMENMKREIEKSKNEYEALKVQLSEKENVRKKTETNLREVVQEFQQFIDLTNGFTKGQSEFLLPDVNLLQDMLKGAVSSCQK